MRFIQYELYVILEGIALHWRGHSEDWRSLSMQLGFSPRRILHLQLSNEAATLIVMMN